MTSGRVESKYECCLFSGVTKASVCPMDSGQIQSMAIGAIGTIGRNAPGRAASESPTNHGNATTHARSMVASTVLETGADIALATQR